MPTTVTTSNVLGYNVKLALGSKTIVGVTQDDLDISAQSKDSITKDDSGVKKSQVTGHDISFKVSAVMMLDSATGSFDRDGLIEQALKTGSSAEVAISYTCSGGDTYTGTGFIQNYTESTPADPSSDANISLTVKVSGTLTKSS